LPGSPGTRTGPAGEKGAARDVIRMRNSLTYAVSSRAGRLLAAEALDRLPRHLRQHLAHREARHRVPQARHLQTSAQRI
jgi:hypothetical protein